jgi:hypothetical protein
MFDLSLQMDVGAAEMSASLKEFFGLVANGNAGATYKFMKDYVFGQGKVETLQQITRAEEIGAFVNWDPKDLSKIYPGEDDFRLGELPYSLLASWLDKRSIELNINKEKFKFGRRSAEWKKVSSAGFESLKQELVVYDNRDAIRLFDVTDGGSSLSVQPALYSQQAQTNLIADYVIKTLADIGQQRSLRQILNSENEFVLPKLNDARLANTLGISVLVLCHDDDGILRPLLQVRDPKTAAMQNSGIHCTGSKAALWPDATQTMAVENFFDDEAYASVERDFDLRKEEGLHLYPVALVREHARLGKPQLFYFGYTPKSLDTILKFRLERQKEAEIMRDESMRKYRNLDLDAFRKLITTDIWENRGDYKLTHEAYAMLYMMVNVFGVRS